MSKARKKAKRTAMSVKLVEPVAKMAPTDSGGRGVASKAGGRPVFGRHTERHRTERIGWLRAAVLGANDGIVSTASLVVGVAAAHAASGDILIAGVAGLVAGAMSMAAGEYVSVSSQADTEKADLERERKELATDGASELEELTAVYVGRGLDPSLAKQVAEQLTARDALAAHARDELGISDGSIARPVQAALASAATFAVGAAMPLITVLVSPKGALIPLVSGVSLVFLALLGWLGARRGRGPDDEGRPAGHVLGGPRHGTHRGGRRHVRRGGLRQRPIEPVRRGTSRPATLGERDQRFDHPVLLGLHHPERLLDVPELEAVRRQRAGIDTPRLDQSHQAAHPLGAAGA